MPPMAGLTTFPAYHPNMQSVGVNAIFNFEQNELEHGSLNVKSFAAKTKTLDNEIKVNHVFGHPHE